MYSPKNPERYGVKSETLGKLLLTYDEDEIFQAVQETDKEIERLNSNIMDDMSDEDFDTISREKTAIYESAIRDEFNYFCERLGVLTQKKFKTGYVKISAKNINWRHDNGVKYCCFDEDDYEKLGKEVLNSLVKHEITYVQVYNIHRGICLMLTSHDCPTGSFFYMRPCAESTYYRYQ